MQSIKLPLLFLFSLLSYTVFAQQYKPAVHVDSLSKNDFLNLNEKHLSVTRHQDSTVLLLKILTPDGRFVRGLSRSAVGYEIFLRSTSRADSICKEVRLIEVTEKDSKDDLTFSVVLDYSGSMNWAYRDMQGAAADFVQSLKGASFTRVNFDHITDIVNPTPVRSPKPINERISQYGGGTALNRAIRDGLNTLKDVKGPKFVVVFTDGIENSSGPITAKLVAQLGQTYRTPIYGISFGVAPDLQRLRDICHYTQGEFYPVFQMDALKARFDAISAGQFGRYYKVIATCADSLNFDKLVIKSPAGDSTVLALRQAYDDVPDFNDPIVFSTIQFNASEHTVRKTRVNRDIEATADAIINYLMDNPKDKIIIEGHASPDGEEDSNWLLSMNRASAVEALIKDYLKKTYKDNIKALKAMKRIDIDYHGPEKPIFPVDSPYNEENRRVNIVVQKG